MDKESAEPGFSEAQDGCGSAGVEGEALDSLVDAWWSRYCPACQSRHVMSETTCPGDGQELRDRSVTFNGNEETGLPHTTLGSFGEALAAGEGGSGGPPPGGVAGAAGEEPSRRPPGASGAVPDPARRPLPEILGGMWRVGERRGGGTFGSFFVGSHHILGMKVGIKVLRRRLNAASSWRRSFHQEALRVSCLNHPNIVKVFDYGEEEGRPYLVMEYLTGKSLHAYLGDRELDLDDRVEIVRQVAIALSAAHEGAGIGEPLIHLDLKPEHIFVEKIRGKWHVKVIDFGIAEIASAPGTDGTEGQEQRRIAGTLPYMAPERWKYVADPRCDIYSLGIILYELVAGRKPFQAADPKAMRKLHETIIPTPPSSHRSGTRTAALRGLDDLILRCLEKNPDRRPQAAHGLVEEIEKWQARPRLTVAQRVRRAAVAPALTLLLVLVTMYWAPWEGVELRRVSGLALSPKNPLQLEPIVSGLGYEGHEALLLVGGEEGGRGLRIPLVRLDRSQFEVTGEKFDSLMPSAGERQIKARLKVTGKFQRSVTSEPFEITLNNRIPVVLDTPGLVEVGDQQGGKSYWMLGREFTVTALHPLDAEHCTLNGKEGSSRNDGKTLTFKLGLGDQKLTLTLFDAFSGNRFHREWSNVVTFSDQPRIVSELKSFTNDLNYVLKLRVAGQCQQLEANGEVLQPTETTEVGFSTYEIAPGFSAGKGCPVTREVTVRLWSPLSVSRKGEPDEEKVVTVEYCRRDLEIQSRPPDSQKFPARFAVVDADGNELLDPVRFEAELDLVKAGKQQAAAPPMLSPDGRLKAESIQDLTGVELPILTIKARDRYGNRASWRRAFYSYMAPPRIRKFELGSPDGLGSTALPLLHPDCQLRDKSTRELLLTAEVEEYPFPLEYELRVVGRVAHRSVSVTLAPDGRCSFDQQEFLGFLSAGRNDVILVARNPESETLRADRLLIVHCSDPLDLEGIPEGDQTVSAGRASLKVRSRSGPRVTRVTAKSNEESLTGVEGEGRHSLEVPVEPYGWTRVELKLEFEGGWQLKKSLRYRQEASLGHVYAFPAGATAGIIQLEYHRDQQTGFGFWLTTGPCWKELCARFRGSQEGKRFRSENAENGVRREEAREIAHWLTAEAISVGLLGNEETFVLPSFEQFRAFDERLQPGGRLWLSWVPPHLLRSGFKAAYVENVDGEPQPRGAMLTERLPFRLIVIERGKSNLNPARALRPQKVTPGGNR